MDLLFVVEATVVCEYKYMGILLTVNCSILGLVFGISLCMKIPSLLHVNVFVM